MVQSKRFHPVRRVAQSREKTAARELGDSQRRMQQQEARLEELRRYHDEYLERFQSAARLGISATQLQEYQAFLHKLSQAIKEQERIVLSSHEECSSKKEAWKQKRVRSEALGKVVERFQTAERRADDTKEQKEQDDRSQRGKPT
jgi:flagellar FliJ protein